MFLYNCQGWNSFFSKKINILFTVTPNQYFDLRMETFVIRLSLKLTIKWMMFTVGIDALVKIINYY